MIRSLLAAAAGFTMLAPSVTLADARASEPEALLRQYVELWNAGDAEAISSRIYRLPPTNPFATRAGLEAEFARLKADGYSRSVTHALDGCLLTPTQAMVQLRFTRLKTDGAPLGPKDRATLYLVRKFPEGWRITDLIGMSPTARLTCTSATD